MREYRVELTLAAWMIAVPLVFAFFGGAGAGTALDGLAGFFSTSFAIFGWVSLGLGVLLLLWVGWRAWRARRAATPGA